MNYFLQIWHSKDLRKKILFTFLIIVIARLLGQVSIIQDKDSLQALQTIFQQNQLLGIFSMLTGGSAENFSIILMGLSPYINASIIIQLLTVIIPKLENLSKEGEQGRRTLNQYTRLLTIPIAFLQSYGMIALLNSQSPIPIINNIQAPNVILPIMLSVTAGSMLLMWLGELITEKGIGNGVSLLIFAGIIAGIPPIIGNSLKLVQTDNEKLMPVVIMILATIALTIIVILITEAQRQIPVIYAGHGMRGKSANSNLPIRVNQAGMIPIIFAVSLVSFPNLLATFLQNSESDTLKNVASFLNTNFHPDSLLYMLSYFLLIIAFTFFYVSITFNPEQVAENIQKRGGYIPGMRPGRQTAEYLGKISNRLNLYGGLFIALIAISPIILGNAFTTVGLGSVPTLISGAGLIIIAGVVLELLRQINAQLVMHDYNKLY